MVSPGKGQVGRRATACHLIFPDADQIIDDAQDDSAADFGPSFSTGWGDDDTQMYRLGLSRVWLQA